MCCSMKKNQGGFTLIEILIAGIILFSVISIVSTIYRGAVLSSSKASQHIELSTSVPLLLDTIRFNIRQASKETIIAQEGIIDGVVFKWEAVIIKQGSAPKRLDSEDGEVIEFSLRFNLWKVELHLEKDGRTADYEFEELNW